jgi:L-lactate utilization protein LutC
MKYDVLAPQEAINKTIEALKANGVEAEFVQTKEDALAKIKELIPAGASIMNGASKTLEQIGFIEYLKSGQHGWNNLHAKVLEETDPEEQAILRKQSVISDFYLGSVHGLSETGEMVIASNTGSQLPHIVFTSANIIFVVGAQKIVPNLAEAMNRLEQYVYPLEDARLFAIHQAHTMMSKVLIFKKENPKMRRKVKVLIINEKLGF